MKNWFPRLVARGFFGVIDPPAFTYDLTSQRYYAAAKKAGGLKNLVKLRGLEDIEEEASLDSGAALMLSSRTKFPSAWNTITAWEDVNEGGIAMMFVEQLPNMFGGRFPGLAFQKDGDAAGLISDFSIEANQAFCERVFLFEPRDLTEDEKDALDAAGWDPRNIWELKFGDWIFRIIDGSFEISRKSANWTQEIQDDLDDLLTIESPTEENQEDIDNLVGPLRVEAGGTSYPDAIYDIHQSLDLGKPLEKQEGKYYELYFIPEPRGKLNVQLAGGKPQSIDIPEIISSRTTGTVYGSTPLTVASNGQCFLWQTGHPAFRPTGSLKIGPFPKGSWESSGFAPIMATMKDQSLPGTSIEITNTGNLAYIAFTVNFTTSNPKYSPFLYGASASLLAGTRDGSSDIVWASSDEAVQANSGQTPIEDCSPSCEGASGAAIKSQNWKLRIQDPWGTVFQSISDANNYEALENRIVDFSAGESEAEQIAIITGGIVINAQVNDAARVRNEGGAGVLQFLRSLLSKHNTKLNLDVADGVAILDEQLITESPILDDEHLGAALRILLLNGGWSTAEIAGVSATAGPRLPKAALGENPCVRPDRGGSRGGYIRSLIETYGLGWSLRINAAGVWEFLSPARSVKTLFGHPVEFSTDVERNNRYTWPGRFAIRTPVDHIRDTSNFFNHFRVEGWIDPLTGERISTEYTIQESVHRGETEQPHRLYLGRLKAYDTIRDDGLRTTNDLHRARNTLRLLYGRSFRFVQFETYFHIGLLPGDLVRVDGVLSEIVRIPGGSLLKDSMTLVCMELE